MAVIVKHDMSLRLYYHIVMRYMIDSNAGNMPGDNEGIIIP